MDDALNYAQWYFWVHSCPSGSEISRYDTYKQVEKSSGKAPVELLSAPSLPVQCFGVWGVFSRMHKPSYTEIKSYMDVTGDILDWWEIELLINFDRIRRSEPSWQRQQS